MKAFEKELRSLSDNINLNYTKCNHSYTHRMEGKFGVGEKFGKLTRFEHLAKESLVNNRSANRLLMISTNLDGFSLANHGRFAKFTNVSPH